MNIARIFGIALLILMASCRDNHTANGSRVKDSIRTGLNYYLKGQNDLYYRQMFNIVHDGATGALARQVATDNLVMARRRGFVPTQQFQKSKDVEFLAMICSANKKDGSPISYSIEFEVQLKDQQNIKYLVLHKNKQQVFRLEEKDFYLRSANQKIWFARYFGQQAPLGPGVYTLTLATAQRQSQYSLTINEFPKTESWPAFPITKKLKANEVKVDWTDFQSSIFDPNHDLRRVTLSTSMENQPPVWSEQREPASASEIKIRIDPKQINLLNLGISYLEQYQWGQLQLIQAINYLMPLNSQNQ